MLGEVDNDGISSAAPIIAAQCPSDAADVHQCLFSGDGGACPGDLLLLMSCPPG